PRCELRKPRRERRIDRSDSSLVEEHPNRERDDALRHRHGLDQSWLAEGPIHDDGILHDEDERIRATPLRVEDERIDAFYRQAERFGPAGLEEVVRCTRVD